MNLDKHFKTLLENKGFRDEWNKTDLAMDSSTVLIEMRTIKQVTQTELAKAVGLDQSAISRAERDDYYPSLRFIEKIANKLGLKVVLKIEELQR